MPIVVREIGAGERPYLNKLDEELRASGIVGSLIEGVTWHGEFNVLFVHVVSVPTVAQGNEIDRLLGAHDPTTLAAADVAENARRAAEGKAARYLKGYTGAR